MDLVDVIVIVIAGFAALRGFRRGLLSQAFEFGGGFLGLIAGIALGPRIASVLTDRAGVGAAMISLIVVFVALSLGQAVGYVIGHRTGMFARAARFGTVDLALGAGFGIAITLVSFWLVGSLLVDGPSRPVAKALRH